MFSIVAHVRLGQATLTCSGTDCQVREASGRNTRGFRLSECPALPSARPHTMQNLHLVADGLVILLGHEGPPGREPLDQVGLAPLLATFAGDQHQLALAMAAPSAIRADRVPPRHVELAHRLVLRIHDRVAVEHPEPQHPQCRRQVRHTVHLQRQGLAPWNLRGNDKTRVAQFPMYPVMLFDKGRVAEGFNRQSEQTWQW